MPAEVATVPCSALRAEGSCSKGPMYAPAYHAIRVERSDRQVLSDSPGQQKHALISSQAAYLQLQWSCMVAATELPHTRLHQPCQPPTSRLCLHDHHQLTCMPYRPQTCKTSGVLLPAAGVAAGCAARTLSGICLMRSAHCTSTSQSFRCHFRTSADCH